MSSSTFARIGIIEGLPSPGSNRGSNSIESPILVVKSEDGDDADSLSCFSSDPPSSSVTSVFWEVPENKVVDGVDGDGVKGYETEPIACGDELNFAVDESFRSPFDFSEGVELPLDNPKPTPRRTGFSSETFVHSHFQTSSLIRGPFPV